MKPSHILRAHPTQPFGFPGHLVAPLASVRTTPGVCTYCTDYAVSTSHVEHRTVMQSCMILGQHSFSSPCSPIGYHQVRVMCYSKRSDIGTAKPLRLVHIRRDAVRFGDVVPMDPAKYKLYRLVGQVCSAPAHICILKGTGCPYVLLSHSLHSRPRSSFSLFSYYYLQTCTLTEPSLSSYLPSPRCLPLFLLLPAIMLVKSPTNRKTLVLSISAPPMLEAAIPWKVSWPTCIQTESKSLSLPGPLGVKLLR
ncbi:hypothetical protein EI94DRAFT_1732666 [Lactarius quietus]|nr:hypothetical protein EI94DRAFT_1732666 [Lactarius quietus]